VVSWQLIETAPVDEAVLVIHKHMGIIEAKQCSTMLRGNGLNSKFPWDSPASDGKWLYTSDLTHWMPLPPSPTDQGNNPTTAERQGEK